MRALSGTGLLLLLAGLLGCREVPGKCSGRPGFLCIKAQLDALSPAADRLEITVTADTGKRLDDVGDLAAVVPARQFYMMEIDLSTAPEAQQLAISLLARRGGEVAGLAQRDVRRDEMPQPVEIRLEPVSSPDLRDAPDMAGPRDLRDPPDLAAPTWQSGMPASYALGGALLWRPTDVCYTGSRLYVSDRDYHRVLVFDKIEPGSAPVAAIGGQFPLPAMPSMTPPAAPTDKNLNAPQGLWCQGPLLFVADAGHHRVLYYDSTPGTGASAAGVAGQPDRMSGSKNRGGADTPTANSLKTPYGVVWDEASNLYIADRGNNRVLVYTGLNELQLANLHLHSASIFLGQGGQPGKADPMVGPGGLSGPESVLLDSLNGRLAVVDNNNNRVTVYNAPPGDADAAVGQPGLGVMMSGSGADQVDRPASARTFDGQLFVSDRGNNRVLIFDQGLPKNVSGIKAVAALGADKADQKGPGGVDPQMKRLTEPGGLAFAWSSDHKTKYVIVADSGGHRVLVFSLPVP